MKRQCSCRKNALSEVPPLHLPNDLRALLERKPGEAIERKDEFAPSYLWGRNILAHLNYPLDCERCEFILSSQVASLLRKQLAMNIDLRDSNSYDLGGWAMNSSTTITVLAPDRHKHVRQLVHDHIHLNAPEQALSYVLVTEQFLSAQLTRHMRRPVIGLSSTLLITAVLNDTALILSSDGDSIQTLIAETLPDESLVALLEKNNFPAKFDRAHAGPSGRYMGFLGRIAWQDATNGWHASEYRKLGWIIKDNRRIQYHILDTLRPIDDNNPDNKAPVSLEWLRDSLPIRAAASERTIQVPIDSGTYPAVAGAIAGRLSQGLGLGIETGGQSSQPSGSSTYGNPDMMPPLYTNCGGEFTSPGACQTCCGSVYNGVLAGIGVSLGICVPLCAWLLWGAIPCALACAAVAAAETVIAHQNNMACIHNCEVPTELIVS